MERNEPWLPTLAIRYLAKYLDNQMSSILEFGSGSSTKWLNDWTGSTLRSIEHEQEYYELNKQYGTELHQRPYNNVIDNDEPYDVILVDGRDRVKCIKSAIPKLKPEGILILDNSEREYYKEGIDLMKDWNSISFRQGQPDKYGFTYPNWTCTIFIKP